MHAVDWGNRTLEDAREGADVDGVAVALLREGMALPGVVRVGLALTRGAGRELAFTASDRDNALSVDWCSIDGMADVPLTQAVRSGAPIHLADVDALYARYPVLAKRQIALGTRALAAYPLVDGDARHGGVLLSFEGPQPFDDPQRTTLAALAMRTAVALSRAHELSRVVARAGHGRGPQVLASPVGVWLAQHHGVAGSERRSGGATPTGTGWVDAVPLTDGAVLLAAGSQPDGADSRSGATRRALRDAVAAGVGDPVTALARLALTPAQDRSRGSGSPVAGGAGVAVLDAERRRLCVATTGALAVVVTGRGAPQVVGPPEGGLGWDGQPRATEMYLQPGAAVVLVSDPAVDSGALASAVGRLAPHHPDPLQLALLVGQELGAGAGTAAWSVLVARLTAGIPARRLVLDLPDDATAPRLARRTVRTQLHCWGAGALAETAEACVCELCTNALMHSGTGARLVLAVDPQRVLLLVQNGGAGQVQRPDADDDDVGGRGLMLVEALSSRWDWQVGAEGTTVWCELDRDAGAGHPGAAGPAA